MKKGNLIVLTVLLLTVLTACTGKYVKFTGFVDGLRFGSERETIFISLTDRKPDEAENNANSCRNNIEIEILRDELSESVRLGDNVHMQCYCDRFGVVAENSCILVQD